MSTKPEQHLKVGDWWYLPQQDKLVKINENGEVTETADLDNLCQKAINYFILNAGRLITRDEILQDVWGVRDVSDGRISRVIRVLRVALGDDSREPTYIETIPKRGFRFIAPIAEVVLPDPVELELPTEPQALNVSGTQRKPSYRQIGIVAALLLLVCFVYLMFTPNKIPDQAETVPFVRYEAITSLVGLEFDPAVSPDGKYLAFVHVSDFDQGSRLMVQNLATNSVSTISKHHSILSSPVWRPDGKALAYQKILDQEYCQIRITTLNDDRSNFLSDELLFECGLDSVGSRIDWSPDGSFIVYPNRDRGKQQISLMLFPVSGGQQEQLTVPPQTSIGDYAARFSKSGKHIAFLRYIGSSTGEIWVMDLDTRASKRILELKGEPPLYIDWYMDDKKILFASSSSSFSIVDIETKKVEHLYDVEKNAMGSLYTRQGRLITQVGEFWKTSLMKVNNPLVNDIASNENIFQSSRNESLVQANAIKGGPLAVHSSRSGIPQIWFYYPNGSQKQVSNFEEYYKARNMEFSNDGKYLIANVANSVWLFSSDDLPRKLTNSDVVPLEPSWSADGKYVYFNSGERGRVQILRVDINSKDTDVVDTKLDFFRESANGQYTIARKNPKEPYQLRFKNSDRIIDLPILSGSNSHPHFALSNNYIYFSESQGGGVTLIKAYDLKNETVKSTEVKMTHTLKRFTVTADEKYIYYPVSTFGDIDIVEVRKD